MKKEAVKNEFSNSVIITPLEILHGEAGMHDQITIRSYIHEYGDNKVIKMIFERGLDVWS